MQNALRNLLSKAMNEYDDDDDGGGGGGGGGGSLLLVLLEMLSLLL